MFQRTLTPVLLDRVRQSPVVTVTGPRQSGKTTLVRTALPDHAYVSLEDPELRSFALEDPRGFLRQFAGPVILDEVQRTPELFSYLQGLVDDDPRPGRFVLSGSQNFLLLRSVSQSLAGRAAILHLLPLSLSELEGREPFPVADLGLRLPGPERRGSRELFSTLFRGFYPRIHDRGLSPEVWLADYYRTYVERDVREIVNVGDLETFGRFVRHCAHRSGQLLNLSSLATDSGVSQPTARRWLSILESSFLVTLLRPYHENFGKRLIKTPKLYFLDSGLLCFLLRIRSPEELRFHAARGALFESFVVAELIKSFLHQGREPNLWFWRDAVGLEIDLVLDEAGGRVPVELKSGETLASDAFARLERWRALAGDPAGSAALIYGGDRSYERSGVRVYSWSVL